MNWCYIDDESRELTGKPTIGAFFLDLARSHKIRDERFTQSVCALVMRIKNFIEVILKGSRDDMHRHMVVECTNSCIKNYTQFFKFKFKI